MANKFVIEVRAKGFTNLEQQLQRADKATKGYEKSNDKLRGTTSGLRRQIGALRNNILLYTFAVGAAGKVTGKFIRDASKFESVKTRLVGLTGSVQKAEQAFSKFNDVAATTPFTLDDVVNAGAQLEAFGANSQMLLKEITDLAAFMGTTATEAANSFGRAFAGGAGAADILRERGILNIIKDSQGLTDLSKTTLPEFREALIKSLQDPTVGIAGSTDRLSQTFEGAFSNMKDAVTLLSVEIGETLMPSIKSATVGIGNLAKAATRFLKDLKGEFDSPEFKQSIEGLLEGPMAKFQENIKDFDVKQLSDKLKELQKQLKATAPTALTMTKEVEAFSDSAKTVGFEIIHLTGGLNKTSDGMITLKEISGGASKDLLETALSINTGTTALEDFAEKTKTVNEDNLLSMEINEQSREFILAQIEILRTLIGLKEEEANLTKTNGDKDKERNDRELDAIHARAKAFRRFSDQLARAVVDGQSLGTAVINSLRAIAAELTAQAASFAILQLFSPNKLSAGKLGFDLLAGLFPKIAHDGGPVQKFANGGVIQGRDNVPILAQAGEFIIKRDSAQSIGLDALTQMNDSGQASSVIVNINGGVVQDDYVRNELIPAINTALTSGARINA